MQFREGRYEEGSAIELTEKQIKARRMRNIAIAFGLIFMVVAFYAASIAKFTPKMLEQQNEQTAPTETKTKE